MRLSFFAVAIAALAVVGLTDIVQAAPAAPLPAGVMADHGYLMDVRLRCGCVISCQIDKGCRRICRPCGGHGPVIPHHHVGGVSKQPPATTGAKENR
jgi:hypothetical protein